MASSLTAALSEPEPGESFASATTAPPTSSEEHGTTLADILQKLPPAQAQPNNDAGVKPSGTKPTPNGSENIKPASTEADQRPAGGKRANTAIASLYGRDSVTQKQYEDQREDEPTTTTSPRPRKARAAEPNGQRERRSSKHSIENRHQDPLVSGRRAGAGWTSSRIRWAPANVPLQRRLQTMAVLWHGLSPLALLGLFLFLCAIPLLWPVLLPYLIYCLFSRASTSGELAFRSETLRRSRFWSLFASYFPVRLHRSAPLPPTRKYVFGYHPHGIISHGAFAAFCTEACGFAQLFPGLRNTLLTLDSNFRVPFYRDYILALGLASVSRESCENLLSRGGVDGAGMGRAITIVVGGARESLDAEPGRMRLVLHRRKGFVKLAIRNGADLVPVLGFGENDLFDQFSSEAHPHVHRAQLLVKRLVGFTLPLFHARGIFNYDVGLLPYRVPVNIVVGRPIPVERHPRPDEALVDELHARYVDELLRLWDENKDLFAKHRKAELEVVE